MNNLFKKKIVCSCGKFYNGKLEGNSYNYICSGYKNYKSCKRHVIHESDLINIIRKHLELSGRANISLEELSSNVMLIRVADGRITIEYCDGSESLWCGDILKI